MSTIFSAFMDGFTGGGLLVRVRRPGAPTQVFADQESTQPQEQLVSSLLQRQTEQVRSASESTIIPSVETREAAQMGAFEVEGLSRHDRAMLEALTLNQRDRDEDFRGAVTHEDLEILGQRFLVAYLREEEIVKEFLSKAKERTHGVSK